MAGFTALLSQEQSEIDDFQRRYRELNFRGLLGVFRRWRWIKCESMPDSQIITHWRMRPEVRWSIYMGLLFFVIALISGHFSSLPK